MFQALMDAAARNELILIDGGYCLWHLRRDGQLTITEILATKPGAGSQMLEMLKEKKAFKIVARCPACYESNEWYRKKGFVLARVVKTRTSNKDVNEWIFNLNTIKTFQLK